MIRAMLSSLVLVALLTGCDAGAPVSRPDATVPTPTWAPAPSASPAGSVVPVGGPPSAVATGPSGTAVALPAALLLLDTAGAQVASVPVTEPVRSVVALPGGGFRAVSGSTVLTVGDSGVTTRWALPAAGGALVVHPDGWTAVAVPSLGNVIILSATGAVTRTLDVGGAPGGLAVTGDLLAVLDPAETSLTVYDATSGARKEGLRAGDGATTVTTGGAGRFVAVDARDGELLVFETGPLVLRQRHPVPGTPYAAAFDPTRNTLWVTITQRNEVVGYNLAGGAPREVARHPTPRLPIAVAVDATTGTLVVAGSAEGLVQRISP
ncbi:hypothetical protein AB0H83_23190 [Dactylosporangium sp. NPDC050688]|uniref:YncE family protein n=1 Tax=Dactylosporangium sp. NPDC050688 TaxID=3157217 RepID=UPI0034076635